MSFEITSTLYRRFLWTLLILWLLLDIYSLWQIFASNIAVPGVVMAISLIGFAIRVYLLITLLAKKGPIKQLVAIWATFLILSGASGLLALILSSEPVPAVNYFDKGLFLIIGLLLVLPLSKSVTVLEKS